MAPTTAPGRPPRTKGTSSTFMLTMRMTVAEGQALRAVAASEGRTVSDLVRSRIFAQGSAQGPVPAPKQKNSPDRDLSVVLAAARAELARSNIAPMVMVAAVVRACKLTTERAHAALIFGSMQGLLELRPESGMGRLSKEDAALCVPGQMGSVLSVLRVV